MLKNWRKERGVSTVGVGVVKSSKRKEAEEAVCCWQGNQPTLIWFSPATQDAAMGHYQC